MSKTVQFSTKCRAGRERLEVPAGELRPAAAQRVHGAAEDAVVPPAGDHDRVAAQPPERAAGHQAVGPATDVDAVAPPVLERQAQQHHVLDVFQRHERRGQDAEDVVAALAGSTPSGAASRSCRCGGRGTIRPAGRVRGRRSRRSKGL